MAMRLAIFGCGGFGREVLGPARQFALAMTASDQHPEVIFVSDEPSEPVLGTPVVPTNELTREDQLVIAVGLPSDRRAIAERLHHIAAGMVVAPSASIGPGCEIAEGAILCANTVVTASAVIGRHFHANIFSYVAHDCVIGDFVTFAPRVSCNGRVHVHDGAYIGTGAILREGKPGKPLIIGAGAVVGAGSVVLNDVAPGTTVVGIPAKPLGVAGK
jgi:sugar O-acyltransferase (sialic acid O-acetyltransferase NeuD family)